MGGVRPPGPTLPRLRYRLDRAAFGSAGPGASVEVGPPPLLPASLPGGEGRGSGVTSGFRTIVVTQPGARRGLGSGVNGRSVAVAALVAGLVLAFAADASAAPSNPNPTPTSTSTPTTSTTKPKPKPLPGSESKPPRSACRTLAGLGPNSGPPAAEIGARPWPQKRLRYEDAWQFTRGEGVTVAVVDSGVDARQVQLRGHVATGLDVTSGRTTRGGTTDCAAHGTAVAGIIAARPRSGIGLVGIAPGATILPIRQSWGVDRDGNEVSGTVPNLLRALREAVTRKGVRVVNVSVTLPVDDLTATQRRAFESVARKAEANRVVIVAASGNVATTGEHAGEQAGKNVTNYPAALAGTHANVIAVSGITADGTVDPTAVTGSWVTVAAPGSSRMTCVMAGSSTVVYCKGTSYAAPFVSGLVALIVARYPGIAPAEVRRLIELTADHPSTDLPDAEIGYGVINPLAAVTAGLPSVATPTAPQAAPPLTPPTPADDRARFWALVTSGLAAALAVLLSLGAAVVRRGRSRGWRPGHPPAGGPTT